MLTTDGYVWRSDTSKRAFAEGEARGEARILLRLLAQHGIDVPESARRRITACTDLATLDRWVDRVKDAKSIDAVLD